MKTQKHTMKRCQEHAKPTGGDITLTEKPCWPIKDLPNVKKKKEITVHTPGRSFQKGLVSVT